MKSPSRLKRNEDKGGQTGQCPWLALGLLLLLDDVAWAQLLEIVMAFEEIKTCKELMRKLGKKRSATAPCAPTLIRLREADRRCSLRWEAASAAYLVHGILHLRQAIDRLLFCHSLDWRLTATRKSREDRGAES